MVQCTFNNLGKYVNSLQKPDSLGGLAAYFSANRLQQHEAVPVGRLINISTIKFNLSHSSFVLMYFPIVLR